MIKILKISYVEQLLIFFGVNVKKFKGQVEFKLFLEFLDGCIKIH